MIHSNNRLKPFDGTTVGLTVASTEDVAVCVFGADAPFKNIGKIGLSCRWGEGQRCNSMCSRGGGEIRGIIRRQAQIALKKKLQQLANNSKIHIADPLDLIADTKGTMMSHCQNLRYDQAIQTRSKQFRKKAP
jgi:hypothetical protein